MFDFIHDLFTNKTTKTKTRKRRSKSQTSVCNFETLEPRKMLASISVHAAGQTGDEAFNLIIDNHLVETFRNVGGDVESRNFQEFNFRTQGPVTADRVQIEFINDFAEGDYDRNLFVDRIVIDGREFQTEANTTRSTGFIQGGRFTGEGFFETETLNVNGTFSFLQANEAPTGTRIRIDALGETGLENVQLQVDGQTVRNFRFSDSQANVRESFFYTSDQVVDIEDIRIRFTNDLNDDYGDRNLTVFSYQAIDVASGEREIAIPTRDNVFSRGVYNAADGFATGFGRGNTLSTNGFFEVRNDTTPALSAFRLRVDASGTTGDELFEVSLGNRTLGQFQVTQSRQAFFVDIDSNFNLQNIKVSFVNDFDDGQGNDRNLIVNSFQKISRFTADRQIVNPASRDVLSTGTYLAEDGVVDGFGRGNTLNANGFFRFLPQADYLDPEFD